MWKQLSGFRFILRAWDQASKQVLGLVKSRNRRHSPSPGRKRRVAQAFDFASNSNTWGAPPFALFAKGGSRECLRKWVADGAAA
jgi:hypothetical protein